jgi:hypothetical protein
MGPKNSGIGVSGLAVSQSSQFVDSGVGTALVQVLAPASQQAMANKAVTLRYLLGRTSFFRISCSELLEIALPIFWEFHADVQEVQNGGWRV